MRNIQQSCTAIPPHMLRHLAEHDESREKVTATLRQDGADRGTPLSSAH